jgi:hypothetical protein
MASWREIERIRNDPRAARDIARYLLKLPRGDFTDWEIDFLESVARRSVDDELTTRQSEKLLQIRDDAEFIAEYRGFGVGMLLRKCFEARLDLSEDDEDWIVRMSEKNQASIRRKHVGRLMRCSRELKIVEEEEVLT